MREFHDIKVLRRSKQMADPLSAYIYQHYWSLLTPEEQAARHYLWFLEGVHFMTDGAHRAALLREKFRIDEIDATYPQLAAQVRKKGIAAVMRRTAERVLREHAEDVFVNTCPMCDTLCFTPRAKACLSCGHTWHDSGEK